MCKTSGDNPTMARIDMEPVLTGGNKAIFEGDLDELAESEEDDDAREVFIDEEDVRFEYGDLINDGCWFYNSSCTTPSGSCTTVKCFGGTKKTARIENQWRRICCVASTSSHKALCSG